MTGVTQLRISYWLAAIADFAYAITVLIPSRAGVGEYVYPMGLFATVAFSWGVMLVLADRRPLERRWVLVPTIFVIVSLGIVNAYSFGAGDISFALALPRVLLTAMIAVFLLVSYVRTGSSTPPSA